MCVCLLGTRAQDLGTQNHSSLATTRLKEKETLWVLKPSRFGYL